MAIPSQLEKTMTVAHLLSYNLCCTSCMTNQKSCIESFGERYPSHGDLPRL